MIAIRNTKCIDAIGMGSLVTADIACSLCHHEVRGQMFEGSLPRNRKPFMCRALDLPFTDKDIQACGLKGSTEASWQSAVRRHTRAFSNNVVVVVVVVVLLLYAKPQNNTKETTRVDDGLLLLLSYLYNCMFVAKVDMDDRTTFVLSVLTTACFINDGRATGNQKERPNDDTNIIYQR